MFLIVYQKFHLHLYVAADKAMYADQVSIVQAILFVTKEDFVNVKLDIDFLLVVILVVSENFD